MINRQIVLAERPHGAPTDQTFRTEEVTVPALSEGEVLVRTIYLSLDPYMRGRMNDTRSYVPPVQIGAVMEGGVVGEVVASNNDKFAVGDIVNGSLGWQEHAVSNGRGLRKVDPSLGPISTAVGVLGMPGMTAYTGLKNIGLPADGETLVVAAASGAVGAVVGQIAKIRGCRVVGLAGSQEKCDYVVNACGFDVCINHRASDMEEQLAAACPDGIDVYWENVGGEVFKAVLPLMNDFGRIPVCGIIAHYNDTELATGVDRLPMLEGLVLRRRLTLRGFIVSDFKADYADFLDDMSRWVSEGKIRYREDFVDGLDNAPQALAGLLEGQNFGKLIVRVGEDPTLG